MGLVAHRKMALCASATTQSMCGAGLNLSEQGCSMPEDGASASIWSNLILSNRSTYLSTASSCSWAALAGMCAAPTLLRNAPASHPVCESSIAIVGWTCGANWSASTSLIGATLAMNPAAPFFLGHTPTSLPISKPIGTIVRVGRRRRRCWHHWGEDWRQDWHRWRRR